MTTTEGWRPVMLRQSTYNEIRALAARGQSLDGILQDILEIVRENVSLPLDNVEHSASGEKYDAQPAA